MPTGRLEPELLKTRQQHNHNPLQYQLYMKLKPCLSISGTYRYRHSL